jgi:ferredoxin
MAVHKIKLITPEGLQEFVCPNDVYILDQAKEVGIDLPYWCRVGLALPASGKFWKGAWISLTRATGIRKWKKWRDAGRRS